MKELLKSFIHKLGYDIIKTSNQGLQADLYRDMEDEFFKIEEKFSTFTMTSRERMYALYKAVQYIVENKIPGDIVECGVWKGGSAMICARCLLDLNDISRKIFLYDTYEGMAQPTAIDISSSNEDARTEWAKHKRGELNDWCYASLEEVKQNMLSTGYPIDKMVFVPGKVEDTIPEIIPEQISLLRLDTDWYKSTKHELEYLYPKIAKNGILILDDYGHWKGAKTAVDEYFDEEKQKVFLNRIDLTGRLVVKPTD